MKAFLDSNVLLDLLVIRDDERLREDAATLLQLGKDGLIELYMNALSIPTIAYILKGHTNLQKRRIIKELLSMIRVLPSTEEHISDMIDSRIGDIEDALQFQSALEGDCDLIVSRDRDLRSGSLPVFTPEELLKQIFS